MSDGFQHQGALPRRLRDDFDSAPQQQRMGPERVPRRNPSTDQKKARTQMSRQSALADSLMVDAGILDRLKGKQPQSTSDPLAMFRGQPAGWYLVARTPGAVHDPYYLIDGPYPSRDEAYADASAEDDPVDEVVIIAKHWDGTKFSNDPGYPVGSETQFDRDLIGHSAATKESTMTQINVEADLLARVAAARTLDEQRGLQAELAAFRQAKTASLRTEAEFGISREALAALSAGPAPSFVHHTAASDWLSDVADAPVGEGRTIEATMRAEASLWYDQRPEAIKANAMERTVQAHGVARRMASQYGASAEAAYQSFMAQVEHLAGVEARTAGIGDAPKGPKVTQDLADTHVPSGSSLPEGVTNKSTFDDSLLTAPGGSDPKSTTNRGDSASLGEGGSVEGDHAEGIENPAVDTTHDQANKSTTYTDPNPSGGKSAAVTKVARSCPECGSTMDVTATPADNPATGVNRYKCPNCGTLAQGGKSAARHVAEDQKSPAADGATPSLSEGTAPEGDHAEPVVQGPLGTGHDAGPGDSAAVDSIDGTVYPKQSSLRAIAASIVPEPASAPFVSAMAALDSVEGSMAGVPGRDIVAYVLRTASLSDEQRSLLERHLAGEVPPQFKEQQKKSDDDSDDDDKGSSGKPWEKDVDQDEDSDEDKDADKPWEKSSALRLNPTFASRVQASLQPRG